MDLGRAGRLQNPRLPKVLLEAAPALRRSMGVGGAPAPAAAALWRIMVLRCDSGPEKKDWKGNKALYPQVVDGHPACCMKLSHF